MRPAFSALAMTLWLGLFFSVAATAGAQTDFHAFLGTEDLLEGGRVEKFVVVSGAHQFSLRPPKNWTRQVDEPNRRVVFKSPSGQSALSVLFSTNSPGEMPSEDELRAMALAAHPGSGIVQYSVCPTSYRPGVFFDLVQMPAPNVVQKIRHAYVAEPQGLLEMVLTSSKEEFEGDRIIFMSCARAFRVEPRPAKAE